MNHVTQLNSLMQLRQKYKDYMSLCPNDKLIKLTKEITKIQLRIEFLQTLKFDDLVKEVPIVIEVKQSRLNF